MSGRIGDRFAPAAALADEKSGVEGGEAAEEEALSTDSASSPQADSASSPQASSGQAAAPPAEQAADAMAEAPVLAGAPDANGDDAKDELPPVEELVQRLRPEVLTTLDELFRAKWIGVKRVRPEDLKSG